MNIHEPVLKIKSLWQKLWQKAQTIFRDENSVKYYTVAVIILVGLSAFGLGRLSVMEERREPVVVEDKSQNADGGAAAAGAPPQSVSVITSVNGQTPTISNTTSPVLGGRLVASRNGTKYYLPWCSGATKITDANKIWFNSEADARVKGYQPATNCKGIR